MVVKEISDSLALAYLNNQPPSAGLFLQHPAWLKVEETAGFKTIRLGFFDDQEKLIGLALGSYRSLSRFFKYVFFPRGPLLKEELAAYGIKALAGYFKNKVLFIRFEPLVVYSADFVKAIKTADVNPAATWLTDLQGREQDILAVMHSKTRYNIRLAQKNNLIFKELSKLNWPDFWELLKLTSRRDGFALHSFKHYANLVAVLPPTNKQPFVKAFGVYQADKLLAASLVLFYNQTATYLHGASNYSYRNLMAPYFLHWQILQVAKQAGCLFYDWWGIALKGPKQQSWQGVTRFKTGWGGRAVDYPGTFDYPLNQFGYIFYRVLRVINRWLRRLKVILESLLAIRYSKLKG
ncbi:MAG: lipid II:glycine glycyltransferase FemX [Patescibacteria group bacterium]